MLPLLRWRATDFLEFKEEAFEMDLDEMNALVLQTSSTLFDFF